MCVNLRALHVECAHARMQDRADAGTTKRRSRTLASRAGRCCTCVWRDVSHSACAVAPRWFYVDRNAQTSKTAQLSVRASLADVEVPRPLP